MPLNDLLKRYDDEVNKHLKSKGRFFTINIELTPNFLQTCRLRIVEGHKKYGDDWKTKDCLREAEFEKYDLFNYPILDKLQKAYKKKHSR